MNQPDPPNAEEHLTLKRRPLVSLLPLAATFCAVFLLGHVGFAQATAFTYQGNLNAEGVPVNGNYDLGFTLYDALTNGNSVGSVTNIAVGVSNGLFTTTLNFGEVFNGSSLWLGIAVRTNGNGAFTALNPPQPVLPVPSAIYSAKAGTATTAGIANAVLAGNVIGIIPLGNLPSAVVTNNQNHVTFTGALTVTNVDTLAPGATLYVYGNQPLEVHSDYANGIDLYTHADASFRAPYINFYKSGGTQLSPTAVQYGGYEEGSIGGINFGGWDGAEYFGGSAAIYTQADENWTPTNHGGHLSIYGRNIGSSTTQQIIQFGGLDPTGMGTTDNIIFYRPLTWGGNRSGNPGIFPSSNPAVLSIRTGDNSADAALIVGNLTATRFTGDGGSLTNFTHLSSIARTPTIITNSGAGTSAATISIVGTDLGGTITINSGLTPAVGSAICTVTYDSAFPARSFPVCWPGNAAAATLGFNPYAVGTSKGFTLNNATLGLAATTTYVFNYVVTGQ